MPLDCRLISLTPKMSSQLPVPPCPQPAKAQPKSSVALGGRSPTMSVLLVPSVISASLLPLVEGAHEQWPSEKSYLYIATIIPGVSSAGGRLLVGAPLRLPGLFADQAVMSGPLTP